MYTQGVRGGASMSTFDDELYRDDPAEPWTMPPAERKTLRETNPLPITPHYPAAAMVETSWGMRVPKHLRERCENAYHDAKDRMRVRGEEAESEQLDFRAAERPLEPPKIQPLAKYGNGKTEAPGPISAPKRRLLGWEPPPQDHVEAYLRSGGS
jgi:hypothetical protein